MEKTLTKTLAVVVLILLALVSGLFIADRAADPASHQEVMASIDQKTNTVLKLTAASTAASVGISAIPDDMATPIAEKLADFTEYFLLILCVLYAEKYLLTIIGIGAFRILIPAACALGIVALFWNPRQTGRLAARLALVGLAVYLVIPGSIRVSDMIYDAYQTSIDSTIASAEQLSEETGELAQAGEDRGLIASILDRLSETAQTLTDKASQILNRFLETLAVMIVTSCLIPLLVLLFFLWLIRQLIGVDLEIPGLRRWESRRSAPRPDGERDRT